MRSDSINSAELEPSSNNGGGAALGHRLRPIRPGSGLSAILRPIVLSGVILSVASDLHADPKPKSVRAIEIQPQASAVPISTEDTPGRP